VQVSRVGVLVGLTFALLKAFNFKILMSRAYSIEFYGRFFWGG